MSKYQLWIWTPRTKQRVTLNYDCERIAIIRAKSLTALGYKIIMKTNYQELTK